MPAGADKHQKTEKPTAKRKKQARDDGQLARSPDIYTWVALVAATFVLPSWFTGTEKRVLGLMAQASGVARAPTTAGALSVFQAGLRVVLLSTLPLAAVYVVLVIVTNLAQVGRALSLKKLRPKFSRLNPKGGLKQIFSAQSGVSLLKQTIKLTLLIGVAYSLMNGLVHTLVGSRPVTLVPLVAAGAGRILSFVRTLSFLGLVVGIADYGYQRKKLSTSLKMTKEEVKDEAKAAEGDPTTKAMVKKRMYQIARGALPRAVRSADVVVTNPTHYAVALQYDAERGAPRVLAKGADHVAARIRAEAATWSVPLVEDPPLARYLYAVCEVDQQIPPEIYLAVAKILAFVYALPEMVRTAGAHHPAPSIVPSEPSAMATMTPAQRQRVAAVLSGVGK